VIPYYADESVTLWHGDCRQLLPGLADGSVDAVVTDPPYGLEFMGREWDTFGRGEAASAATAGTSAPGIGKRPIEWPSFLGGLNPRCRSCDRSQRGGSPCRCENPDFTDERGPRLRAFQAWCTEWAAECLRVLKPGGHLLAFGGTRTYHRLTCAIEDAGFEIRDSITWIYGSGFPKSLDVSKAIDKAAGANREVVGQLDRLDQSSKPCHRNGYSGPMRPQDAALDITAPATPAARQWAGWGTALKPASEPIVVARKPLSGTVAANVLAYGTGALNIDACRIESSSPVQVRGSAGMGYHGSPAEYQLGEGRIYGSSGRWPTNVVLSHAGDETVGDLCAGGCVPGCPVADMDAQSGVLTSGAPGTMRLGVNRSAAYGAESRKPGEPMTGYGDSGGASRFFPVFRYEAKAPTAERPRVDGVAHATVKPLGLMRWLVRLVTPPGGLVLDLFAGSGTTGEACIVEGFRCVLIEEAAEHLPLIRARLGKPIQPTLFGGA
jgi:DNA modification methylase